MKNRIEKLQERLETLHVTQDARLACNADDLDIREEIAKVEEEIKELEDDINEKNSNVTDTNVGDIEEAVKTMEHWVEYEKSNKDKINKADELIYIQEIILSDYKRVLEINEVLLKENEMYKKNSEIMSKENLSTAEQLKVEIKENFRLKNQLENNRKEYQETYKDVREEIKNLKKENEEWQRAYQEEKDRQFDLIKDNEKLKEYIAKTPNLDEMTATKYRNIQQEAYIQGRAEEQRKARKIIYENYIPVQKAKDKIEKEIKYHERNILEIENITMLKSKTAKEEAEIEFNKYAIVVLKKILQELIEESEE